MRCRVGQRRHWEHHRRPRRRHGRQHAARQRPHGAQHAQVAGRVHAPGGKSDIDRPLLIVRQVAGVRNASMRLGASKVTRGRC